VTTFADALNAAMTERGASVNEVARRSGIGAQSIVNYRRGKTLPKHASCDRLATALDWPRLSTISRVLRTRRCKISDCGRQFTSMMTNHRRLYCSIKCQQSAYARRKRGKAGQAYRLAIKRQALAQGAIDAMCKACEPADRICRDAGGDGTGTCPLRAFSPFPFIPIHGLIRRRNAA
jgi:hypothetical protein